MSPEIARLPNLHDVLEEALLQCENISSGEVGYVLGRIVAHAETMGGRLEVAGLLGNAEHALVTTVPTEGGDWANEVVIRADDLAGLELHAGETVLVVSQRRWEA